MYIEMITAMGKSVDRSSTQQAVLFVDNDNQKYLNRLRLLGQNLDHPTSHFD
jgi:hypothetical protein